MVENASDTEARMKELLVEKLRNSGFGIRTYKDAVFAYIRTRDVEVMEVALALGGVADLVKMRPNADPYRWNRRGVMVKW